jgi:hypothetical protein
MKLIILYFVLILSVLIIGNDAGIDLITLIGIDVVISILILILYKITRKRREEIYGRWRDKTIKSRTERRPSQPITDKDIDDYLELQKKEPYWDDEAQEWK